VAVAGGDGRGPRPPVPEREPVAEDEQRVRLHGPRVDHLDGVEAGPRAELARGGVEVLGGERPEAGVQVAGWFRMITRAPGPGRERISRKRAGQPSTLGSGARASGAKGKALKWPLLVVTSSPTTGVNSAFRPSSAAVSR